MNEKEKAKEFVHEFYAVIPRRGDFSINWLQAKNSALICCEKLIEAHKKISIQESGCVNIDFGHVYWEEFKQQIEKL